MAMGRHLYTTDQLPSLPWFLLDFAPPSYGSALQGTQSRLPLTPRVAKGSCVAVPVPALDLHSQPTHYTYTTFRVGLLVEARCRLRRRMLDLDHAQSYGQPNEAGISDRRIQCPGSDYNKNKFCCRPAIRAKCGGVYALLAYNNSGLLTERGDDDNSMDAIDYASKG